MDGSLGRVKYGASYGAYKMTFPSQRHLLVPPGSSTKLGMFRIAEQFPLILPLPTLNHAQKNVGVMLTAAALSTVQQQKTVTVISIWNVILHRGSIRITPSAEKVVIQDIKTTMSHLGASISLNNTQVLPK